LLPDYLRIRENAPNERGPLARLKIWKNWSARILRKHLRRREKSEVLTFDLAMLNSLMVCQNYLNRMNIIFSGTLSLLKRVLENGNPLAPNLKGV
jgi:hypothetical protein